MKSLGEEEMVTNMIVSPMEMVQQFHEAFGGAINVPFSDKSINLRIDLIDEEVEEVVDELMVKDQEGLSTNLKPDTKKLTKELADLLYVVYGAAVTFGLPLEEVFVEVHKSNMSKLGEDGKPIYREDGKILKGPNYKEPDLGKLFDHPF